ncbi:mutator type transposase [Tanacetum coccineum]
MKSRVGYSGSGVGRRVSTKATLKAHAVETRRKIGIVKNDNERVQAKYKGNVPSETSNVDESGNLSHACGSMDKETRESVSQVKNKLKGKSVKLVDEDKRECLWKVYISVGDNLKWVVRTLKNEHKCQQSKEIRACTSTFLSKHVVDLIHTNPEIPIKAIQEHMHKQFQVGVSKTKAFRSKAKAEVHLKDEFRASGRELLGLDRAFMKGNYPGQMITAVSVDVNNGIYPVAYGIVESESKDSWTWFLSCLEDDLDLYYNSNFTFIIDRQKGLLPALQDPFPADEHKYCVRHIHDNINLIYKGGHYKELLWKCATAITVVALERAMDEFKGKGKLEYLMKRIVIVQKVIEKSQGPLTPTVTKIFNAIKEKASQLTIVWNGAKLF